MNLKAWLKDWRNIKDIIELLIILYLIPLTYNEILTYKHNVEEIYKQCYGWLNSTNPLNISEEIYNRFNLTQK